MASDFDYTMLAARVSVLESVFSVDNGRLTLTLDGAEIELSKFGITIACREFVVKASNRITIQAGSDVTIKGSKVNVN